MTIAGTEYNGMVSNWLNDKNKNDKWNIGERIVFPFEYDLDRLGQFDEVDVVAVDDESNSIVLLGSIELNPISDAGVTVSVNNQYPNVGDLIEITITVTSYGGDVEGSGNVDVRMLIPEALTYVSSYSPSGHGSYDNSTGIWSVGDVIVGNPANLTIQTKVTGEPYHAPTQLVIIFDGNYYTQGCGNVWQNTLLNGMMFALRPENYGTIPADGSVELTVISCGWSSPAHAESVLDPTIITMDNAPDLAQYLRNRPYPGGYAPISSAIRLATDLLDQSNTPDKRQIVLIVTPGNPDCIWNGSKGDGYGADYVSDLDLVHSDTIAATEYLNETIPYDGFDELNVITVAKSNEFRNSTFFNESIVMPKPGHIYDINNPIEEPGWVFEVEPGKEEFNEAFNLVLDLLLNSINFEVYIDDSTTLDLNALNDAATGIISPQ
jgi:hypothetical protein